MGKDKMIQVVDANAFMIRITTVKKDNYVLETTTGELQSSQIEVPKFEILTPQEAQQQTQEQALVATKLLLSNIFKTIVK